MNRFNLTFSGEILPGEQPALAKKRFGELFGIDDPVRLERFFSGDTITLRRNLDRKAAAQCFQELRRAGLVAQLVKIPEQEIAQDEPVSARAPGLSEQAAPRAATPVADNAADIAEQRRRATQAMARRRVLDEERNKHEARQRQREAKREAQQRRIEAEQREREAEQRRLEEQQRQRETEQRRLEEEQRARDAQRKKLEEKHEREAQQRRREDEQRRLEEEERRRFDEEQRAHEAQRRQLEEKRKHEAQQRRLEEAQHERETQRLKSEKKLRGRSPQRVPPVPRSKRRRGAPNLYAMHPFRNTRKVRERAGMARQKRVQYLILGVLGAVALIALAGFFLQAPASAPLEGAAAIAADDTGGLVVLAGDQLLRHDRAGNAGDSLDLATLGVKALAPPLTFAADGALFATGILAGTDSARPRLLRCDLAQRSCIPFSASADDIATDTFALHPLGDGVFVADAGAGQLLKVTAANGVAARAALPLPRAPTLTPHNGLLLANSAQGPAIGVFRYDSNAFGEQLDEVLLLPPGEDIAQLRVGDFLWNAGAWWVTLYEPRSGRAAVHRFDGHWNHLAQLPLTGARMPLELVRWGEKTLVNDHRGSSLTRFNANGDMEVALRSASLARVLADSRRAHHLRELGRFALLLAAGLVAVAGLSGAWLQHLRALVYRGARPQGAEPVDDRMDAIHWIEAAPRRRAMLRRRGTGYALLAFACCLVAMGTVASAWQLAALLTALAGPAAALWLFSRSSPGSIGVLGDQLLLVDHSGLYHLGTGSRVQYRGAWLFIDDVAVFTGTRLLPAFAATQLRERVWPLARAGIKVDHRTVLVKTLQNRHPITLGNLAILTCLTAAGALLLGPAML